MLYRMSYVQDGQARSRSFDGSRSQAMWLASELEEITGQRVAVRYVKKSPSNWAVLMFDPKTNQVEKLFERLTKQQAIERLGLWDESTTGRVLLPVPESVIDSMNPSKLPELFRAVG